MGRGRQKAKHTKVARELKYFSPETNYGALERELAATGPSSEFDDLAAKYADFAIDDEDDEEEEEEDQAQYA